MKYLNALALLLVIIGGLNWLLVGVFDFNLVHWIFGGVPYLDRIIYIIVGIAALICLPMLKDVCPYPCPSQKNENN
jgi:hypothetical protein